MKIRLSRYGVLSKYYNLFIIYNGYSWTLVLKAWVEALAKDMVFYSYTTQ